MLPSLLIQSIRIALLRSLLQLSRRHGRIRILQLLLCRGRSRSDGGVWKVWRILLQSGIEGAAEVRAQSCQVGWLGFVSGIQGFDGLGVGQFRKYFGIIWRDVVGSLTVLDSTVCASSSSEGILAVIF